MFKTAALLICFVKVKTEGLGVVQNSRSNYPQGGLTLPTNYDILSRSSVPVAQPDRVTGYEPVGQGFESLQARQKKIPRIAGDFFVIITAVCPARRGIPSGTPSGKSPRIISRTVFRWAAIFLILHLAAENLNSNILIMLKMSKQSSFISFVQSY
jgi:hypothetical protein